MKKAIFLFAVMALGIAIASPVKSIVGARETFLAGSDEPSMPTAADYIQDGLIAMWDGIENAGYGIHNDNATVWKDLIGNHDLIFVNAHQEDTFVQSTANGNLTVKQAIYGSDFPVIRTCELCYRPESVNAFSQAIFFQASPSDTNKRRIVMLSKYGIPKFKYQSGNGGIGFESNIGSEFTGLIDETVSMAWFDDQSPTVSQGAINGELRQLSSPSGGGASTVTVNALFIGAGGGQIERGCVARYYNVRLYSRVLTPEEIAYNYSIDKARFNLP